MSMNLNHFNTAAAAALDLAQRVAQDLRQALASHERALLLLSGGRSPLPFFTALAAQDLPWQYIDVSLVDERSVSFDHPDSNAGMLAKHLLHGAAASARLLLLMAEGAANEEELAWAMRSAQAANANSALAHPAVIVLGLGNDGHTASLFNDAPQWQAAITAKERYVALQPGHAPHARVSLSMQALIRQRTCYAWTSGADKFEVIKKVQALLESDALNQDALQKAGAFALLAAQADVTLQVFHSAQT